MVKCTERFSNAVTTRSLTLILTLSEFRHWFHFLLEPSVGYHTTGAADNRLRISICDRHARLVTTAGSSREWLAKSLYAHSRRRTKSSESRPRSRRRCTRSADKVVKNASGESSPMGIRWGRRLLDCGDRPECGWCSWTSSRSTTAGVRFLRRTQRRVSHQS